jgi:hypothetical protein
MDSMLIDIDIVLRSKVKADNHGAQGNAWGYLRESQNKTAGETFASLS